jgi:hypothetical protein
MNDKTSKTHPNGNSIVAEIKAQVPISAASACENQETSLKAPAKTDSVPPTPEKQGTSEKKIAANRLNAQRSTGPKNTSHTRQNAVKHGLSTRLLTKRDDREAFERNLAALKAHYASDDPFAECLAEEAALDMVRMKRIHSLEADGYRAIANDEEKSMDADGTRHLNPELQKEFLWPLLDRTHRFQTATMNRIMRNRRELRQICEEEPSEPDLPSSSTADPKLAVNINKSKVN